MGNSGRQAGDLAYLFLDVVQLLLKLLHVGVGGVLIAVVHCGRRGRGCRRRVGVRLAQV